MTTPNKSQIEHYKIDAVFTVLKGFDAFARDEDFIEVSLWRNGEGFEVNLSSCGEQHFQMTWGQFNALKKLVKELDG